MKRTWFIIQTLAFLAVRNSNAQAPVRYRVDRVAIETGDLSSIIAKLYRDHTKLSSEAFRQDSTTTFVTVTRGDSAGGILFRFVLDSFRLTRRERTIGKDTVGQAATVSISSGVGVGEFNTLFSKEGRITLVGSSVKKSLELYRVTGELPMLMVLKPMGALPQARWSDSINSDSLSATPGVTVAGSRRTVFLWKILSKDSLSGSVQSSTKVDFLSPTNGKSAGNLDDSLSGEAFVLIDSAGRTVRGSLNTRAKMGMVIVGSDRLLIDIDTRATVVRLP